MSHPVKGDGRLFSVLQLAKILHVSDLTVTKWIDQGHLKGFRLPPGKGQKNAGNRRVLREDLISFMKERGIPMNLLEESDPCVFKTLTIGLRPDFFLKLRNELGEGFQVGMVPHLVKMGVELHRSYYNAFLIHTGIGRGDSLLIAQEIRTSLKHEKSLILGIAPEGESSMLDYLKAGFDFVWQNYVQPDFIVEELKKIALRRAEPFVSTIKT